MQQGPAMTAVNHPSSILQTFENKSTFWVVVSFETREGEIK